MRDRITAAMTAAETRLEAALAEARARNDHPGIKGDHVETAVRQFLAENLPSRYRVGDGEVVDRHGERSPQSDVVICNDEQPFGPSARLAICEGVSAIGEVKSCLGSKELRDIFDKGRRVKQLRYSHMKGDLSRGGTEGDRKRYWVSPPYFAVALESDFSPLVINKRLGEEDEERKISGEALPTLDALFVLGVGAFVNFGSGDHSLFLPRWSASNGRVVETRADGWCPAGGPSETLVTLFGWLHATMPRFDRAISPATFYAFNATSDKGSSWVQTPREG